VSIGCTVRGGVAVSVLYVTDLDGTLLDGEQRLSNTTIEVINSLVADGTWFTIATARAPQSALPLLTGLDLQLPMIFMNGALIVDPADGRAISRSVLEPRVARRVVDGYLAAGLLPFVHTIDIAGRPHVYYPGVRNACERFYVDGRRAAGDERLRLVTDFTPAFDEAVLSTNACGTPAELAATAAALGADPDVFAHFGPDIYVPGYAWLEVCHPRANKGDAVRFVRDHVGADRLVCFGDNTNDLQMFSASDECYAVANAHPAATSAATGCIGSNLEHGVALHLRAAIQRT
jgi:5-amino-6-(5-phospho-D-ribitylamino)uracil phosphatase